jgi:vacuolar-type H+-ATPase catalytic subunit A/Vma1
VDRVAVMDVDTVLMIQDILKEKWLCQKKYLNLLIIILIMETNKMYERVLEIQKNIITVSPEQQTEMLNELLELASKLEQSLSEIKIEEINEE